MKMPNDVGIGCLLAEFRNKHVPNKPTANLDYVRAAVTFKDKAGKEVQFVSPCAWMNVEGDQLNIEAGGESAWVLLAAYDGQFWVSPKIIPFRDFTLDVFGIDRFRVEKRPLPQVELTAEISLMGDDNIALPPAVANFKLGSRGTYEIIAPA